MRPVVRGVYRAGMLASECLRWCYAWAIVTPVVRSIADVGRRLRIERIPYIRGPGRLVMGDGVYISGKFGVSFSRHGEGAEIRIGNHVFIGHETCFSAAREIIIGDHCLISAGVRIQDNDGHPLDAERRKAGEPVDARDIEPIIIEDGVWIGQRAIVLKGVRIGRDSVVGAGAVVTRDVPPSSVVAGVPARVVRTLERGKCRT